MKNSVLLSFVFLAILTSSCVTSNSDDSGDYTIAASSTEIISEGSIGTITIETMIEDEFSVELSSDTSTLVYVQSITGKTIKFIAPNVKSEEQIPLSIRLKMTNGDYANLSWTINVLDREIKAQIKAPKPNVFSTSNLKKHESRLFDSSGVPLYEKDDHEYYYPVNVAQYSYDLYNHYYKYNTQETLDKFLTNATWLRDNCIYTGYGFCSYRSEFAIDSYK